MQITNLMTNHLVNPIGYHFSELLLSWKVSETKAVHSKSVRIWVSESMDLNEIVYDSGEMEDYRENSFSLDIDIKPRARYYWKVWIKNDMEEEALSQIAYFETGKCGEEWYGSWIRIENENKSQMPVFYKEFELAKEFSNARIYICGLGLYEAYLNGKKIGNEYLMPGYHSYDCFLEYQTIDIEQYLIKGKNRLEILLGDGWYKGRFGFDEEYRNIYGSYRKCIAEIWISCQDKTEICIATNKEWNAMQSTILENNIYDGESIDRTLSVTELKVVEAEDDTNLLCERSGPPIHKVESFIPIKETFSEDGSLLIDFGESVTGWVEWNGSLDKGQRILLQYGEVLQNDTFYNDNLRTAKAEFSYVSDGEEKSVRPHFTYYGFRYVKISGLGDKQQLEFTAYRLMSDIPTVGTIITSNNKVNQLFENTLRSQKCNFLDIPTDCPQRDERMGWTCDAAIFLRTACFHMDSVTFFRHYTRCMSKEQKLWKGAIPFFVPFPKVKKHEGINPFYISAGVCGWGDAATIIPWTLYQYYGDIGLLREQYPMMCSWISYVTNRSSENEIPYLWQNDRQLGDWLALDNGELDNPIGKTDTNMIASAFYYYSTLLCYKAAKVLEDKRETEFLELTHKIKKAFLSFYFNDDNSLKIEPTQTACAFLLQIKLYPKEGKKYLIDMLKSLLEENDGYLNTGFIGTPVLCPSLSDNGMNDKAYGLLLNEKFPGWLYEVNLGATTVWERWNSINNDGTISSTGMNSLNHYAYGSISDWMYRYMCGFHPSMGEDIKMRIQPMPDRRIERVSGTWESVYGTYKCEWKYVGKHLQYYIEIPFNANAEVILTNGSRQILNSGSHQFLSEA